MANDTLLVIGIHRKELGFGDRVAARIDHRHFDVLRIARGIPQPRRATDERFLSETQHHEIYLQLHQQVKDRYRLMIDLHQGIDPAARSADVFGHDATLMSCLDTRLREGSGQDDVRLVRIAADDGVGQAAGRPGLGEAEARTWIPPKVWLCDRPVYVGVEVYLQTENDGDAADWDFTCRLLEDIRACSSE